MSYQKDVQGLHQNKDGLCKPLLIHLKNGAPDFEFYDDTKLVGETKILGWGDLDGPAEVWESQVGKWSLLVPIR